MRLLFEGGNCLSAANGYSKKYRTQLTVASKNKEYTDLELIAGALLYVAYQVFFEHQLEIRQTLTTK